MVNMENASRNLLRKIILSVFIFTHQNNAQYVVDVMRITTFGEEELVHKCEATGGNFGRDIADFMISDENLGCGISVEPIDACGPIHSVGNHSKSCHNLFAFVSRSDSAHPCKFSHQAFMVQNSTYPFRLVVFYNYPGLDPISMEGTELRDKVNVPVVMVSHACRDEIMKKFLNLSGYRLRVRIDPGYYELFRYLIPFLVVIVFCFTLFVITLCVRGCVERRKSNKRRLSKRNLRKIPMKKYRLGDEPDTCAICLENFIPGEKLRHLPCKHVFHCNCIDVWLTQTRKVCPLCKRKIGSDSDSDCSNDLFAEDHQRNVEEINVYQVANEFTPAQATQSLNMWSSREALVHQDILLMGNARRSLTGFIRNAVRRLRNSNRYENEQENEVGLENNAYSARHQATFFDSEHLLENDTTTPVLTSVTSPSNVCQPVIEETMPVNTDATTLATCSLPSTFISN